MKTKMAGRSGRLLLAALCGGVLAVAPSWASAQDTEWNQEKDTVRVVDQGLMAPESAIWDDAADVYLVSNVNGETLAKDGNGFISRIGTDGTVQELRWIDGAGEGVTLNGPKGLALKGDTLLVADIDAVRLFDREDGSSLGTWQVAGARFLNDVSVGSDGAVYVTDTAIRFTESGATESSGTDVVYRFDENGNPKKLATGEQLSGPNGVLADEDGVIVVTVGSNELYSLNEDGTQRMVARLPKGQLDGVVKGPDGIYLVSSWEAKAVYGVDDAGNTRIVVDDVTSPAGIGYDGMRDRVLVPMLQENEFRIAPLHTMTDMAETAEEEYEEADSVEAAEERMTRGDRENSELRIGVARDSTHGEYLTDANGRALYLFEADSDHESTCYEACAGVWPPVTVSGRPQAADTGVRRELIGTIERRDGTTQLTYNGWPLYYYTQDRVAGETRGQDVMGFGAEWYLITPAGHEVEEDEGR